MTCAPRPTLLHLLTHRIKKNIFVAGVIYLGKTITIRIDDDTYKKIKSAAESEKRTISNFMEYATIAYLENSSFITDDEMIQIVEDHELMNRLQQSVQDIKRGNYRIVE